MKYSEPWNRCDGCGKFIAHKDFGKGATYEVYSTYDSISGVREDIENSYCKKCNEKEKLNNDTAR